MIEFTNDFSRLKKKGCTKFGQTFNLYGKRLN